MSERAPGNRPEYYGNYNGERVYFNPDNTIVYLHRETPGADHLFVVIDNEVEEEPSQSGFYVWRAKHHDVFTQMAQDLLADGCNLVALDRVSDFDANNLAKEVDKIPDGLAPIVAGDVITNPEPPKAEITTHELTERQERTMHFLAYLLQNDRLMPADFELDGELFI
jgi:hypothetical protein